MKGLGGARPSYEEIGSSEAFEEPAIPPPPKPPSVRPPAARPAATTAGASDRPPPPRPPRDSKRPGVRALQLDEEEAAPVVPRRNLTALWLTLAAVVVVGGGLYWAWPMIESGGGTAPETPGARFSAAGEAALARDRLDAYEDAADEFTKALAFDEHDVRAQIGLARAHALVAQARLFEADDLEARAGDDATLRGEAAALRRQAADAAAEARTIAETAVRRGGGGADAELALADALRLVGERDLARSRLDRARTMEPEASAEALRVEALWTAGTGAGAPGLAAARDLAAQAVARDGNLLRARLLLARASLAAGDAEAARRETEAVLARDGAHREALALRDRAVAMLSAAPATPTPATATPTTPTPTTPTPTTPTPTTPTPTTPTPSTRTVAEGSAAGSGGGTAPVARDYGALVREGESRLERGQIAGARASFEAALRARPGGAEAMTGLGNVMLNEGNAAGAARQFSAAAAAGHGDALIGLGAAYRQTGQREQALEAYRRYLQILPHGSHASVARRQIEALGGGSGSSGSTGSGSSGSGSSRSGGSGSSGGEGGSVGESGGSSGGGSRELTTPPGPTDTPAIESEP